MALRMGSGLNLGKGGTPGRGGGVSEGSGHTDPADSVGQKLGTEDGCALQAMTRFHTCLRDKPPSANRRVGDVLGVEEMRLPGQCPLDCKVVRKLEPAECHSFESTLVLSDRKPGITALLLPPTYPVPASPGPGGTSTQGAFRRPYSTI